MKNKKDKMIEGVEIKEKDIIINPKYKKHKLFLNALKNEGNIDYNVIGMFDLIEYIERNKKDVLNKIEELQQQLVKSSSSYKVLEELKKEIK